MGSRDVDEAAVDRVHKRCRDEAFLRCLSDLQYTRILANTLMSHLCYLPHAAVYHLRAWIYQVIAVGSEEGERPERPVKILMAGTERTVMVTIFNQHIDYALHVAVEIAAQDNGLGPLWLELEPIKIQDALEVPFVDVALLKKYIMSRTVLNDLALTLDANVAGEAVIKFLQSRSHLWMPHDPSACLDILMLRTWCGIADGGNGCGPLF